MSSYIYVGTYSPPNGVGQGLYVFKFDSITGAAHLIQKVESNSPSFLCWNRKKNRLYAANELNEEKGQTGLLTTFKVDPSTGQVTKLNEVSSRGIWPCHLALDPSGQYVMAANYSCGTTVVVRINADGSLGESTDLAINTGSGPNKERQEGAHAHMIQFDRQGRHAILVDLGLDKCLFYDFDNVTGKLKLKPGVSCNTHPGAGPRHFAEGSGGKVLYVINELDSTVSVFSVEKLGGSISSVQTLSTVPTGYKGKNQCAELLLHPNGRYLYGSNRGHDSIVIFEADSKTGLLTLVGHESTQGTIPRHFNFHPSGHLMFVANQQSDNVVVFRVELATGKLTATGTKFFVPSPICIEFL